VDTVLNYIQEIKG
jgi:cobalamin biosynthesis Co2+ chelatase CbiK